MTALPCEKCHLVHKRCKGHNRAGGPCGHQPVHGQRVCGFHGGKAPRAIANASARLERAAAVKDLERMGVPVETTPLDALVQMLYDAYGNVAVLRGMVGGLDRPFVATKLMGAGEDGGGVFEARPHVLVDLYGQWVDRAARIAKDLTALGYDERRVRLAEAQLDRLVGAVNRALSVLDDGQAEQVRRRLVTELRAEGG